VDPKQGLVENDQADFEKRDAQFGSNYKAPPVAGPFCSFFFGALDDFMLKILLVCAFLSIVIDMSLATPEHRKTGKCNFLTRSLDRGRRHPRSRFGCVARRLLQRLGQGSLVR